MKREKIHKTRSAEKSILAFVHWRVYVIYFLICVALVVLIVQMARLQFVEATSLTTKANDRIVRTHQIQSMRGMITDRSGRPLAVSVPVKAIWADVKYILDNNNDFMNPRWRELASTLGMPLDQLVDKFKKSANSRFLYLARQVTTEEAGYITKLKLPGVYLKQESRRFYPTGEAVSQLVGVTNIDGVGIEGVEKSFDSWLTSKSGERTIRKDRFGRAIEDVSKVDQEIAPALHLTIDERLQSIVYKELSKAVSLNKAQSGSAVLVDVKSGEILAMANSPSYNPNNRSEFSLNRLRNRAITDVFEPGSTVKPIVVMTGLQKGVIKSDTVLDTRPFYLNHHQIRDVGYYKQLSITDILAKSSNVGVSHIALKMEPDDLIQAYSNFGFGKPSDLGLIGDSSGIFPANKNHWSDLERATFAFGYGQMVTPVQLARAYVTIANYGVYRPLSIIMGNSIPLDKGQRVVPANIAKTVLHMMESVAESGGGGIKASIPGYRVAIKTGTAKKVGPQGKYIDEYIAYVAGIVPVSNPRFVLVIEINNPSAGKFYGGSVSAPVFSSIMQSVLRTTNVPPDNLDKIKKYPVVINE